VDQEWEEAHSRGLRGGAAQLTPWTREIESPCARACAKGRVDCNDPLKHWIGGGPLPGTRRQFVYSTCAGSWGVGCWCEFRGWSVRPDQPCAHTCCTRWLQVGRLTKNKNKNKTKKKSSTCDKALSRRVGLCCAGSSCTTCFRGLPRGKPNLSRQQRKADAPCGRCSCGFRYESRRQEFGRLEASQSSTKGAHVKKWQERAWARQKVSRQVSVGAHQCP